MKNLIAITNIAFHRGLGQCATFLEDNGYEGMLSVTLGGFGLGLGRCLSLRVVSAKFRLYGNGWSIKGLFFGLQTIRKFCHLQYM